MTGLCGEVIVAKAFQEARHSREQVQHKRVYQGKKVTRDKAVHQDKGVCQGKEVTRDKTVHQDKEVTQDKAAHQDKEVTRDKEVHQDKGACQGQEITRDKAVHKDKGACQGRKGIRDKVVRQETVLYPDMEVYLQKLLSQVKVLLDQKIITTNLRNKDNLMNHRPEEGSSHLRHRNHLQTERISASFLQLRQEAVQNNHPRPQQA
jgi:hypothetical protein